MHEILLGERSPGRCSVVTPDEFEFITQCQLYIISFKKKRYKLAKKILRGDVEVSDFQVLGGQQKAVEGSLQHVVNEVRHEQL